MSKKILVLFLLVAISIAFLRLPAQENQERKINDQVLENIIEVDEIQDNLFEIHEQQQQLDDEIYNKPQLSQTEQHPKPVVGQWTPQCEIGQSFSITKGCTGYYAFQNHVNIRKKNSNDQRFKSLKIDSSEKFRQTTEVFVKGDSSFGFSGLGVKLTLSAKFVSDNVAVSNSVSWITSLLYFSSTYQAQYQDYKLTDQAKQLLLDDPDKFLDKYGEYCVVGYEDGGQLLASYSLTSSSESVLNDLQTSAGAEVSKIGFSVSAQASFDSKKSQYKGQFRENFQIQTQGSSIQKIDSQYDLQKIQSDFVDKLQPTNLKLIAIPWTTINDVMDLFYKMPREKQARMERNEISSSVMETLSTHYAQLQQMSKDVELFQDLVKLNVTQTQQQQVQKFLDQDIRNALIRFDKLDENALRLFTLNFSQYTEDKIMYVPSIVQNWDNLRKKLMSEIKPFPAPVDMQSYCITNQQEMTLYISQDKCCYWFYEDNMIKAAIGQSSNSVFIIDYIDERRFRIISKANADYRMFVSQKNDNLLEAQYWIRDGREIFEYDTQTGKIRNTQSNYKLYVGTSPRVGSSGSAVYGQNDGDRFRFVKCS